MIACSSEWARATTNKKTHTQPTPERAKKTHLISGFPQMVNTLRISNGQNNLLKNFSRVFEANTPNKFPMANKIHRMNSRFLASTNDNGVDAVWIDKVINGKWTKIIRTMSINSLHDGNVHNFAFDFIVSLAIHSTSHLLLKISTFDR